MKVSDDELIERIRETLSVWADEAPVIEPTLAPLAAVSTAGGLRHRAAGWWIGAAAAFVMVVIALVAISTRHDEPPVDVDPVPQIPVEIPIGHSFGVRGLDVTDGAVWVTSHFDEELSQIDPATDRVVATFTIPDHIEAVRDVDGFVWLSRYEPNEVIRLDPSTGDTITVASFDSEPNLADDGTRLWAVADREGRHLLVQIDPATAGVVDEIELSEPPGPALVVGDELWVANIEGTTVSRVDLATGRVTAVTELGGEPRSIVAAAGSIWVAVNSMSGIDAIGAVVQVDPVSAAVGHAVVTGRWIHSLAADGDTIWATNFRDGTLSSLDASRGVVTATTPIGNRPGGVAIGDGSVWVTPHRRNALVRIDPTRPLEPAASPDVARSIETDHGTVYVRCSGTGTPTAVIEGNTAEGSAWSVVEARLSQRTRVCTVEPVGIADPSQADRMGPASQNAADMWEALGAVGETGPFVVVGEWMMGSLQTEMFAVLHAPAVSGMVLVHGLDAAYLDQVADVLPPELATQMQRAIADEPAMRAAYASVVELRAVTGFGDVPLVVLADHRPDPVEWATQGTPALTLDEATAVAELIVASQEDLAERSSRGRVVLASDRVTPDDIVDAVIELLDS